MSEERAAEIERVLTSRLGHPARHYEIALTTEAVALAWARREEGPEGATVVADQELSARQRKGPPWRVFAGTGLYASVILRPGLPPQGEGLLWLLASLACADGLAEVAGVPTMLKWPDDVLVEGRKVAGVKVEAQLGPGRIESAVLTFRANVNVGEDDFPDDLRGRATSVLAEAGREVDRWDVLDALLLALERHYDQQVDALLSGYRDRCSTLGRRVRALLLPRGEVAGVAADVDGFGSLVIENAGPVAIGTLKKLEVA